MRRLESDRLVQVEGRFQLSVRDQIDFLRADLAGFVQGVVEDLAAVAIAARRFLRGHSREFVFGVRLLKQGANRNHFFSFAKGEDVAAIPDHRTRIAGEVQIGSSSKYSRIQSWLRAMNS